MFLYSILVLQTLSAVGGHWL